MVQILHAAIMILKNLDYKVVYSLTNLIEGKRFVPANLSCVHRPAVASSSQETRRTTVTATLRKSGSIGNLRNYGNSSGFQKKFDAQK